MTNLIVNLERDLAGIGASVARWREQAQLKRATAADCDARADEDEAYGREIESALAVLRGAQPE